MPSSTAVWRHTGPVFPWAVWCIFGDLYHGSDLQVLSTSIGVLAVVLEGGWILAVGTHSALLETCPFYRDLHRKQFSGDEVEPLAAAA